MVNIRLISSGSITKNKKMQAENSINRNRYIFIKLAITLTNNKNSSSQRPELFKQ